MHHTLPASLSCGRTAASLLVAITVHNCCTQLLCTCGTIIYFAVEVQPDCVSAQFKKSHVLTSTSLQCLKHLPSVETRFYCPQAFLSLDVQCRDDVSE